MKPIWPLMAILSIAMSACGGDDHQDLQTWMADETRNMQGSVQVLPKMAQFPVVEYDATALIEPYQPSRLDPERKARGGVNRPDETRRREILEGYPLETLKMVGMMEMSGKPVALIQSDKSIYQVKNGNYLGQNFGVVTKITKQDLTLKELVEDADGDWVERFSIMQLQEREIKK